MNRFDPDDLLFRLERALAGTPPGPDAHLSLAHPARRLRPAQGVEPRRAAVLIACYPDPGGGLAFPLIERPGHDARDVHRGQIGLPGGSREPEDADLVATALREAEEEVGIARDTVRVLGQLSPLYIPVSNFEVQPVVGVLSAQPTWRPQPSEVVRVIEAPLARLLDDDVVAHTDMPLASGVRLNRVPYLDLAGEVVWGATAMMLGELRLALRG